MVKLKYKDVNWVENLPKYMQVLNELAREKLGWKSRLKYITKENQTCLQKLHIRMIKQSVGYVPRVNPQKHET